MKSILFSLIIIINFSIYALECNTYLNQSIQNDYETKKLISYLDQLKEKGVLNLTHLEKLDLTLTDNKVLVNPISEQESQMSVELYIHYMTINNIIIYNQIDIQAVRLWLKSVLKKASEERVVRKESKKQTESFFRPMVFHPVKSGTSLMTISNYKRTDTAPKLAQVTLTQDFEMQETLVTQAQWLDTMGQNPATVIDEDTAIIFKSSGRSASVNLDHPIETISFFSMLVFANEISSRHGLIPAYDMSEIEMIGNASKGTLMPKHLFREGEIEKLKINAPEGNVYKAEGYRLPTDAEWEFVTRARGLQIKNGVYSQEGIEEWYLKAKKSNSPQPMTYAWRKDIVEIRKWTRPVGLLFPLIINGHPFYDLYGNVSERVYDAYDISSHVPDNIPIDDIERFEIDPVGEKIGWLSRGGSFHDNSFDITNDRTQHSLKGDYAVGFRLVRSINLKKQ